MLDKQLIGTIPILEEKQEEQGIDIKEVKVMMGVH